MTKCDYKHDLTMTNLFHITQMWSNKVLFMIYDQELCRKRNERQNWTNEWAKESKTEIMKKNKSPNWREERGKHNEPLMRWAHSSGRLFIKHVLALHGFWWHSCTSASTVDPRASSTHSHREERLLYPWFLYPYPYHIHVSLQWPVRNAKFLQNIRPFLLS